MGPQRTKTVPRTTFQLQVHFFSPTSLTYDTVFPSYLSLGKAFGRVFFRRFAVDH